MTLAFLITSIVLCVYMFSIWRADDFPNVVLKVVWAWLGCWSIYEVLIIADKLPNSMATSTTPLIWIMVGLCGILGLIWKRVDHYNVALKCVFFLIAIFGVITNL